MTWASRLTRWGSMRLATTSPCLRLVPTIAPLAWAPMPHRGVDTAAHQKQLVGDRLAG
jgi:hypothetical protein